MPLRMLIAAGVRSEHVGEVGYCPFTTQKEQAHLLESFGFFALSAEERKCDKDIVVKNHPPTPSPTPCPVLSSAP